MQSTLTAKGTYRLDAYNGEVFQLQQDGNNSEIWHKLRRIPALPDGEDTKTKENYFSPILDR
jgi:hypothetical protein